MMSNTIPRFDLSGMSLKTDEELNTALKDSSGSQDRFFKPGKHELTVVSSEYLGVASDDTWGKVKVTLEGAGGKTINDFLLIPFRDLAVFKARNGENTTKPGQRIVNFLKAVGAETSIAKLGDTLKTYFSKDNSLVGLNVAAEMGYRTNYVEYLGKDAAGVRMLGIVNKNGTRLEGTPTFADYDSAHKYAEEKSIPVTRFVDIVRYVPSATPNARPKADW